MTNVSATMLRDFAYDPSPAFLKDILSQFGVTTTTHFWTIPRFEVISPDSFMWRLLVDDTIYYLYAEDYIPGLAHVKDTLNAYLESTKWELVPVQHRIEWEKAQPVTASTVYQEPDDSDELMKYAAQSGHDFVFLCKSAEDADDARFSDHAARGFRPDGEVIKERPS